MKFKQLSLVALIGLSCAGFTDAYANQVQITVNQPAKVSYRVAHQNQGEQPILGDVQLVELKKSTTIPVSLNGYDLAGVVIVSANGHVLPASANEFNRAEQCSMATDHLKSSGMLELQVSSHQIACSTQGGIFS